MTTRIVCIIGLFVVVLIVAGYFGVGQLP